MPVLSDPAPKPSGPQKSITELRTQTVDLLQDAATATGTPTGWLTSTVPPVDPWNGDINRTRLYPCSTAGSKDANQITGDAYHDPIDEPHVTADILTQHWKSQGFTVRTYIDWTNGDFIDVEVSAKRADGISYDLMVTTDVVAIHAYSECSTHPSFQDVIDHVSDPPPTTPTTTP